VSPPEDPARYQRAVNRTSSTAWEAFTAHRERVMSLLEDALSLAAAPRAEGRPDDRPTLALLGAGNCNDVDLVHLVGRCQTVHLVDLDGEALRRARDRQPPEVAARLVLHPGIDLSGGLDRLASARTPTRRLDPAELASSALARLQATLPGDLDVVVSACLISQIAQSCRLALGVAHPHLFEIAEALVSAHLRALVSVARPGGTAVLVTDVVSSETYPLEELADDEPLPRLLDRLEATDNVLTGTQPRFLRRFFLRDAIAAPLVDGPPRLQDPWLWRLSDELTLLAYALVMVRRPVTVSGVPG
jgi:hypothetical protein